MQVRSAGKLALVLALTTISVSSLCAFTTKHHVVKQAVPIPSSTGCCLFRLGQIGQGARNVKWNPPYTNCGINGMIMPHRTGTMMWKIAIAPTTAICNETTIIPPGSTLVAKTRTISRVDGFAYSRGTFSIIDPSGNTLFTGRIDANDRMGTHHLPWSTSEVCDEVGHVEGDLTGVGTVNAPNWRIHAQFVGKSVLPNPSQPIMITLDGDLIHC